MNKRIQWKGWRRLAWLPVLLLAACTVLEPQPEKASVSPADNSSYDELRTIAAMQERLDHVSGPMLLANANICKKQARSLLGFTAKNRYSYSEGMADAARAALGLGEPLQVTAVMAGSGAESVGLRKGDALIAAGNKPLPQGKNAENDAPAVLAPFVLGQTSVKLTIQRDGKNENLSVPLTRACAFRVELGNTDSVDMYADGRRIMVTRGMLNFVRSDEELAYVIAKGMVHNLLLHPQKLQTAKASSDIINNLMQVHPDAGKLPALKPVPPAMDTLADRLSLVVVARAGLGIDGAPAFWKRLATQHPADEAGGFTARHSATVQRIAAMEKAITQIKSVRVKKVTKKIAVKPLEQPAEDVSAEQSAQQSEQAVEQVLSRHARKKHARSARKASARKPAHKSVKKAAAKGTGKASKKKPTKKGKK
ncbi:MAG: M48 family metallopeptidase [Burkholderiaceae bacterium]|nr:M48 family metallopeptidase [Burkholderiaceae bacterium]